MRKVGVLLFIVIFIYSLLFLFWVNDSAQERPDQWPRRVLITNDDGIDDIKIVELARAFAKVAETYVVAPLQDRSGSTHYLTATKKGTVKVEQRSLGKGIHAYAVDGYPADCVLLALTGLMGDKPPDLVISGINGGPNLGKDWMFSGTIGAARFASFAGFPAIAVSGLDDDMPGAVKAATQWVIRLAQSQVVRELKKHRFLTVSIPRIPPAKIKGVRVAKRAEVLMIPVSKKASDETAVSSREVWRLGEFRKREYSPPSDSDLVLYEADYIVVVPMQADEHDYRLLSHLKDNLDKLPEWPSKH